MSSFSIFSSLVALLALGLHSPLAAQEAAPVEAEAAAAEAPAPEAEAAPAPAPAPAGQEIDVEALKAEIRAELRAALASAEAEEPWEPEAVEAPPAPDFDLFEIDGYFRLRGDTLFNLDLNAGVDVAGTPFFARPGWSPDGSDTLASGNQRLRLSPALNVSEDITLRATVDVLDNVVWGSTPASDTGAVPLSLLAESMGDAGADALRVRRVWAEVNTLVGYLRVGRMPAHFGMGLNTNDGNCLDCDAGDTVDRLMLAVDVAGHTVIPAVDLPSSGHVSATTTEFQGFDLEQRDDVPQWVLAVAKIDEERDIQQRLAAGEAVFNYGLYTTLRTQAIDSLDRGGATGEASPSDFVRRGGWVLTPDLWARLHLGTLKIEAELVGAVGRVENALPGTEAAGDAGALSIAQWGGVLKADFQWPGEKLRLGVELGAASGDSAPGMGVRASATGGYPVAGMIDGQQYNLDPDAGALDASLDNFRFDPNYHVDLILWREIFGRVTDAVYLRPNASYQFTPSFVFDLSVIYSRLLQPTSSASGVSDLGVEIDTTLRYTAADGFVLQAQYGILFPLGGMQIDVGRAPETAQTLQGMIAVEF